MEHVFPEINYHILSRALSFYKSQGFMECALPWVVSRETCVDTFSNTTDRFDIYLGTLVGSAEQSFLELAKAGKLEKYVPYVGLTPAFRHDNYDSLHYPYFMKVELFRLGEDITTDFCDAASDCFNLLGLKSEVVPTDIGFDLEANGIELGSYGYRQLGSLSWTYGTGLAEPRFSYVKGLKNA